MPSRIKELLVAGAFTISCAIASQQKTELPELKPVDIAEMAKKSTLKINTLMGHGSGFAVADGIIITAAHVADGLVVPVIETDDGESCEVVNVAAFLDDDVALIMVTGCTLHPLELASRDATLGEEIWHSGYPKDYKSVTRGTVSMESHKIYNDTLVVFQTDGVINPGMSGGPALNNKGEVVGMNEAITTRDGLFAGISWAVPVSSIKKITGFWSSLSPLND